MARLALGRLGSLMLSDDAPELVVRQSPIRRFCFGENGADECVVGADAVAAEPMGNVRRPRHGSDADLLLAPEPRRGDGTVDAIGEPSVAPRLGFRDRRRVGSGGRPECVLAEERVRGRDRVIEGARGGEAVARQLFGVPLRGGAREERVHHEELHGDVSRPLADAERRRMDTAGAGLGRREGVREGETAVVVAVPVDPDFPGVARDELADERDERRGAPRRRVPRRVAEADARRARVDRGAHELGERLGPCARRVLGDERRGEAERARPRDGGRGEPARQLGVPALRGHAEQARRYEYVDVDGAARAGCDLGDALDVFGEGPRGAREPEPKTFSAREPRHGHGIVEHPLRARGNADLGHVDTDRFHARQKLDLLVEPRMSDRRALQAVPQGLVEKLERLGERGSAFRRIPVVNQRFGSDAGRLWHGRSIRCRGKSAPKTLAAPAESYTPADMIDGATRALVRRRLDDEIGRLDKDAPFRVALAYPSPYRVAMSSLGYQRVYRALQSIDGVACERAFLPDGADEPGPVDVAAPVTYEGLRPLSEFPVVAVSVAYELEIAGLVRLLEASKIPSLASERGEGVPLVLAGGPITFSNPVPLAPFVDALVVGEAEGIVEWAIDVIRESGSRERALDELATHPHVFVPSRHGSVLPPVAACDDGLLPAWGPIRTPHAELSNMFLIETERGCSRGCSYCVMRRSTNGGMRVVPKEVVLDRIPKDAKRVGLVGAAVSDHPRIVEIVRSLAERGAEVGLSSLRPDRLKDEFVGALRLAGYRTLTTALDGASERLRESIERRGRAPHYVAAAERARKHGMDRLKLYLMIGLPGETDADIDECAAFVSELSRIIPVALGIAPFCAKRKTPLDGTPFAGVDVVTARLARLRSGLKGRADVRSISARWAWVEYALAQGDEEEGLALRRAVHAGGRFADYKNELMRLGYAPSGPTGPRVRAHTTNISVPLRKRAASA